MHIHTCFKGAFMSASEHTSPLLQTCSSDLFKPSPLVVFPLCAFPGCVTYSAPCLGLLVDSMGRNSTHTQCTLPSTRTDPPALLLMPDGSATACVHLRMPFPALLPWWWQHSSLRSLLESTPHLCPPCSTASLLQSVLPLGAQRMRTK